ncbi:MAG: hypothetical protein AB7S44_02160 [Spirochaetales bacterium]
MKKIVAVIVAIALVAGGFAAYLVFGTASASLGYVSVDINPSVQFILNSDDEVVGVTASNDDGETILLGVTDELIGMDIEDATQRIVELALEYGYLDPDALATDPNAVTITTMLETQNTRLQDQLRERIRTHLEEFFKNNGIFGVVMTDLDMQDVITEATELGISAGELKLIRSVQAAYPDLTTEELLDTSVKDMMDMLREASGIESYVDRLEAQIEDAQAAVDTLTAQIADKTADLDTATANLATLQGTDTSSYTTEELATYDAQVLALQTEIATLTTEIADLNTSLTEATTLLDDLQTTYQEREAYMDGLVAQAQIRKQAALQKYTDWLANKEQRAQNIANQWEQFQNSLTDEQVDSILDYFHNIWNSGSSAD